MPDATRRALRCLRHPVTLVAVAALVVNDHALKGSGAPGWLTGKLSDVAGLFFFPFLLAAVLGLVLRRPRRAGLVAFVATGAWFAAAKAVPPANSATVNLVELLVGARPVVVVDPTDLVALAILPLAWRLWRNVGAARAPHWRSVVAVAVAGLAALATTPYDPSVTLLTTDGEVLTAWITDDGNAGWEYVYVSDDGGESWRADHSDFSDRAVPDHPAGDSLVVCDPDRPSRCARESGYATRRIRWEFSYDGGVTWEALVGRPLLLDMGRRGPQQFELHAACAPTLPNECYRAIRGEHTDRLERSIDEGRTWVPTFRPPYLLRGATRLNVTDIAMVPHRDSYAVVVGAGTLGMVTRLDGEPWRTTAVAGSQEVYRPTPFTDVIAGPVVWAALLGLGVWGAMLYFGRSSGAQGKGRLLPSRAARRWAGRVVGALAGAVVVAFAFREALLWLDETALLQPDQGLVIGVAVGLAALWYAAREAHRYQAAGHVLRTPPVSFWWVPALAIWAFASYQIFDAIPTVT